jgi:hypothetical protein
MLNFARARLNIQPSEFWKLTFAEWLPMYESIVGKQDKPMTRSESDALIMEYQKKFARKANGNS